MFTDYFKQTFKEELTLISLELFQKTEEGETLPKSCYAARINLISKPDKDITSKENYKSMSLMNTDTKIYNKILAMQIQ